MRSERQQICSPREVFEKTRGELIELVRIRTAQTGSRKTAIAAICREAGCSEHWLNRVLWNQPSVTIHGHLMLAISRLLDRAIVRTEGWARRRANERGEQDAGDDAAFRRARQETGS